MRFIYPKERLYCIDSNQILLEILDFMINNRLFSIDHNPSSKGNNILITYNLSTSLIKQSRKILNRYLQKIKAKKIAKFLRKQKEFNIQIMTKSGQPVVFIGNYLYCITKSPLIDDFKNTNFHYFDFFEKIFQIFYKNFPGTQFDPIIKSCRKYLYEIYKRDSLKDFLIIK